MPPKVREYIRPNAGAGTVIDVNDVDNELTITLNGDLLAHLTGPLGEMDRFNKNITPLLRDGVNILVFSLVNFASTGGWNPASLDASVSIGEETINLSQPATVGQSAPQGLYYQAVFYLTKGKMEPAVTTGEPTTWKMVAVGGAGNKYMTGTTSPESGLFLCTNCKNQIIPIAKGDTFPPCASCKAGPEWQLIVSA